MFFFFAWVSIRVISVKYYNVLLSMDRMGLERKGMLWFASQCLAYAVNICSFSGGTVEIQRYLYILTPLLAKLVQGSH